VIEKLVGATGIEPVTSPMSIVPEGYYPQLIVFNNATKAMISKKFQFIPTSTGRSTI
jgi:hypothetical protein